MEGFESLEWRAFRRFGEGRRVVLGEVVERVRLRGGIVMDCEG